MKPVQEMTDQELWPVIDQAMDQAFERASKLVFGPDGSKSMAEIALEASEKYGPFKDVGSGTPRV